MTLSPSPFFAALLTKGDLHRTWAIQTKGGRPGTYVFRVTAPGHCIMGALPSADAVAAKRREFEEQIAAARADGWS